MHNRLETQTSGEMVLDILKRLSALEPASFRVQMPAVWSRAEGARVYDPTGRCWLDWTSGVLAANLGHGSADVTEAVTRTLQAPLHHAYVYPTELRVEVLDRLTRLTGLEQGILLTTGAEAVEVALKAVRLKRRHPTHTVVAGFEDGFHGRTMGAQAIGGIASQRRWISVQDTDFIHLPYPSEPDSFSAIQFTLTDAGIRPDDLAAIFFEPYQGGTLKTPDKEAARQLSEFCRQHGILLVADEIQSGFGRTGKVFGYQHYDMHPDIVVCGKGVANGFPLSAVLLSRDLGNLFLPGEVSSTHSGNPVCLAAAKATLDKFDDPELVRSFAAKGQVLRKELNEIVESNAVSLVGPRGRGMVAGIEVTKEGQPDPAAANAIVEAAFEGGLLVFAPVGPSKSIIKISPPLTSTDNELRSGCDIFKKAIERVIRQ